MKTTRLAAVVATGGLAALIASAASVVGAAAPAAADTTDLTRLAAYASVPIVQAQAGINTDPLSQRAAVAKVQSAADRAKAVIAGAQAPAGARDRIAAVAHQADGLSALAVGPSLTAGLQQVVELAKASVGDFLFVPNSSRIQLNTSNAPELKDQLTLDPDLGVVQACFVMEGGCIEEGHSEDVDGTPSASTETSTVKTTAPDLPIVTGQQQPSCNLNTSTRIQVVYGYFTFSGAPGNRLNKYYKNITTMAAEMETNVNASAQKQSGTKQAHFVMNSDCTLNVRAVPLTQAGFNGAGYNSRYAAYKAAGLTSTTTKYLVFVDDPNDGSGYCGLGTVYADTQADPTKNQANGHSTQVGFAEDFFGCWDTFNVLGGSNYSGADTALHEMGHVLGAVQQGAPGYTGSYHCWTGLDRMCYKDTSTNGSKYVATYCTGSNDSHLWDCRNDTYFARTPPAGGWLATHWNLYKSDFLY